MSPPESPYSEVQGLYPEAKQLHTGEHPFDVPYAYRRWSMLIEPAIYLTALIRDFELAGGRIVIRDFEAREELTALREPLLFNCTGLGAGKLFGDSEIMPIRGQLSFLLPQAEVQYMTVGPGDIYMFPRRDGILLGGTHERGEWSMDPEQATIDRVLRENGELFSRMRG
jgi:glycine/D-amino acid oxidase-like deaminating enzyme